MLSAETTPVMRDLGNLKKIVCTVSGGKRFASTQSMVEKNFLPPRNEDTSREKIMVCPLVVMSALNLALDRLNKNISFV